MRDIEKALENHFSLHDVIMIMDLLHRYKIVESKTEPYNENGFDDFIISKYLKSVFESVKMKGDKVMKFEITKREFNSIQNICKSDRSTLGAFQLFENIALDNKLELWVRNKEKTKAWILEQMLNHFTMDEGDIKIHKNLKSILNKIKEIK